MYTFIQKFYKINSNELYTSLMMNTFRGKHTTMNTLSTFLKRMFQTKEWHLYPGKIL